VEKSVDRADPAAGAYNTPERMGLSASVVRSAACRYATRDRNRGRCHQPIEGFHPHDVPMYAPRCSVPLPDGVAGIVEIGA
jgi:hypothetical protein